jgi:hypothetical protein
MTVLGNCLWIGWTLFKCNLSKSRRLQGEKMSWISEILGVKDIVLGVLDRIKLSPEKKAEIELQMQNHAFDLQKMDIELESKLADAASKNIVAEASSGDKFTSRARPLFMYVVNFILVWNYIIVPIFHHEPLALPEPLFWLFGSCVLGYTGARTWEKIYSGKAK